MVVFVVAAGFVTYGLWLFVHDEDGYENTRAALVAQREELAGKAAALEKEAADLDANIAAQERRMVIAGQVIKTLKGFDSTWDRWIWNRAQQRAYDEQSARMQVVRKNAEAELVHLRHDQGVNERDYDAATLALAQAGRVLSDHDSALPVRRHYLNEAWHRGRWYVAVILLAYLLGPTLVLLGSYYLLAPFVARGRAMRLAQSQADVSTASAGMPIVESAVWPGETLLVRKRFIAASDTELRRKTRPLLSWRFPFASVLAGLWNLAELKNVRNNGGRRITLAGAGKATSEFTVVEVPERASLVVRPGFMAGVLSPAGVPLVIRRRWCFLRWQSWAGGQFRFFEFVGPCRLILVKKEALKVENLVERADGPAPAARLRQMAVVAFTPNLECRPVRAVSFWRYYIGATKLFEAGFAGPGLVVHSTPTGAMDAGSCGLRRRALKLLGL